MFAFKYIHFLDYRRYNKDLNLEILQYYTKLTTMCESHLSPNLTNL